MNVKQVKQFLKMVQMQTNQNNGNLPGGFSQLGQVYHGSIESWLIERLPD